MHQVDLIRRYSLRKVNEIRLFISQLPTREQIALERLHGAEGIKVAARIADFILSELGHPLPVTIDDSPTIRAARTIIPKIDITAPQKPRLGRPPKVRNDATQQETVIG